MYCDKPIIKKHHNVHVYVKNYSYDSEKNKEIFRPSMIII